MAVRWDPTTYLRFGDERARPFWDLLARVDATDPAEVVDLGCGPGTLTVDLATRWPGARVHGLDSSPDMIAAATALGSPVTFEVADVRGWVVPPAVDVVVANAVLQWVPDHVALVRRWVAALRPGAVLAFQVPGNFTAPSHRVIRELAISPQWKDGLADALRDPDSVLEAAGYAVELTGVGCRVDAWETTYVHQLPATGPVHPVLTWVEGTALRPVRDRLTDDDWARFRAELEPMLAAVYPVHNGQVFFPFRRIFVVATRL